MHSTSSIPKLFPMVFPYFLALHVAAAHETTATIDIGLYAPVTMNDPTLTEAMVPALSAAAEGKVRKLESSESASEDFSYYAEKVPGLYVFLGATTPGTNMDTAANNHSPKFLVDDSTLITGVQGHVEFVLRYPEAAKGMMKQQPGAAAKEAVPENSDWATTSTW